MLKTEVKKYLSTKIKATLIVDLNYLTNNSISQIEPSTFMAQLKDKVLSKLYEIIGERRSHPIFTKLQQNIVELAFTAKYLICDPKERGWDGFKLFPNIPQHCEKCKTPVTNSEVLCKLAIEIYKCRFLSDGDNNKSQEVVVVLTGEESYEGIVKIAKEYQAVVLLAIVKENTKIDAKVADGFVEISDLLEKPSVPIEFKKDEAEERKNSLTPKIREMVPGADKGPFETIGIESAPSSLTERDYRELLKEISVFPRYVWVIDSKFYINRKYVRIYCWTEGEAEKTMLYFNRNFGSMLKASHKEKEHCPYNEVCVKLDQQFFED